MGGGRLPLEAEIDGPPPREKTGPPSPRRTGPPYKICGFLGLSLSKCCGAACFKKQIWSNFIHFSKKLRLAPHFLTYPFVIVQMTIFAY